MGIKMYGLHLGSFGLDLEMMLPGHPDLRPVPGQAQKKMVWYQCPVLAYVIEHPKGRILFETGMSPHWKKEWPEPYRPAGGPGWGDVKPHEFLEPKLKAVGLGLEDFRYVVMGHMHADHAGGLRIFEEAGAEIILHEDEYKGVLRLEEDAYFMSRADYEFLPRKKPTLAYGDMEFLKGIRLVSLPGHTWGTMGMMVHLNHTGWVFHTTDAMHHHKSYGPPPIGNMITLNQEQWLQSMEKIRRQSRKYEALIAPGHDKTAIKQKADGSTQLVELKYFPGQVYE